MDQDQLLYTTTHEWAAVDGDVATVGVTQYAVDQLTDVTHVEPRKVGSRVEKGTPFGEIESVKAVFDLNSPVTGEVIEVNSAALADPTLINGDPYGKGWLIKVRLAPGEGTGHLLSKAAYDAQLAAEPH